VLPSLDQVSKDALTLILCEVPRSGELIKKLKSLTKPRNTHGFELRSALCDAVEEYGMANACNFITRWDNVPVTEVSIHSIPGAIIPGGYNEQAIFDAGFTTESRLTEILSRGTTFAEIFLGLSPVKKSETPSWNIAFKQISDFVNQIKPKKVEMVYDQPLGELVDEFEFEAFGEPEGQKVDERTWESPSVVAEYILSLNYHGKDKVYDLNHPPEVFKNMTLVPAADSHWELLAEYKVSFMEAASKGTASLRLPSLISKQHPMPEWHEVMPTIIRRMPWIQLATAEEACELRARKLLGNTTIPEPNPEEMQSTNPLGYYRPISPEPVGLQSEDDK